MIQAEAMGARGESAAVDVDRAVAELAARAGELSRLSPAHKAALLRALPSRLLEASRPWVRSACHAKGLDPDAPRSGEEWLAGPVLVIRNARLLAESLEAIHRRGSPPLGRGVSVRPDGRVVVDVFPSSAADRAMLGGLRAAVLLAEGMTRASARDAQASFYRQRDPEGGVSLVLGAGNVSSIAPMDALHRIFVEGRACVVKMNPVNAYLAPYFEHAFAPLVERGYLRFLCGGSDLGAYLVSHPAVSDVHITGSERTHDLIIWGPPGPEREARRAAGRPLLDKPITSELGNVSPVILVPALYDEHELWFQARSVATMVANNASFNCNAAKLLVVSSRWPQREQFMTLLARALSSIPPRRAYYPGAHDRYASLLAGRDRVERIGPAAPDALPWALVRDLDPRSVDEPLFRVEPFCALLSEVALEPGDPTEFLDAAVAFCNQRVWGTLNVTIVISPMHEDDPTIAAALDRAILDLRYGTVCVNHWPGVAYGLVTPPWGGHPGATLADPQSGSGFVHNTYMLGGIEKTVLRGPIRLSPKPPWFSDHRRMHQLGERLARFEARPGLFRLTGLLSDALRG